MPQHFVDIRLCSGATCLTLDGCESFSLATDGSCGSNPAPNATSSSFLPSPTNDTQGTLLIWSDPACSIPSPSLSSVPLTLDGACHSPPYGFSYTAARRRACLAPDPQSANAYTLSSVSAARLNDAGNPAACAALTDYQHCMLQSHAPIDGLFVGLCVPAACAPADLTTATSSIFAWMAAQVAPHALDGTAGLFEAAFSSPGVTVRCGSQAYAVDAPAGAVLGALGLCAALVALATALSLMYPRRPSAAKGKRAAAAAAAPTPLMDVVHASSLCTSGRRIFCLAGAAPAARAAPAAPARAFSLAALDGVRVLSLSLVVLGHSFFFPDALLGYSNTAAGFAPLAKALATAPFQVIPSAEFAVDTFFLLSGALGGLFLTTGLQKALARALGTGSAALRQQQGRGGGQEPLLSRGLNDSSSPAEAGSEQPSAAPPLSLAAALATGSVTVAQVWLYSVLHRYLRLLPSVGTLILLAMYVMPLLGSGPFWRYGMQGNFDVCKDHAWSNLLFVNNFFPGAVEGRFDRQCVGWLWYLAVDMQLHAVALPPLALCATLSPYLGWPALVGALAATLGLGSSAIVKHSLSPLVFGAAPNLQGDSSDYYYDQPLCRAPAFLIGVGLGWALMHVQQAHDAQAALAFAATGDAGSASSSSSSSSVAVEEEEPGAGAAPLPEEAQQSPLQLLWQRVLKPLLPLRPAPPGAHPHAAPVHLPATLALAAALALLGALFYLPTGAYRAGLGVDGFAADDDAAALPPAWGIASQQWYMAVSRPLWAAGCAVLLFCCAVGAGGALNALLAHAAWRPLAALSFQMYLYHPLVLDTLGFSAIAQPTYTPAYLAEHYAATCVLTAAVAGVVYVLVEAPAAALEQAALAAGARALKLLAGGAAAGR